MPKEVRFPTLSPESDRAIGGVRQSQTGAQTPSVQEPVSMTIRPGRPVQRTVRAVLRELGLLGRRP